MTRKIIQDIRSFFLLVSVVLVFALSIPLKTAAQGITATTTLEQIHFLIDPDATNICDLLVYRDLNGNVVSAGQISTQITDRVAGYCGVIFPELSIRDMAATNFLGALVGMPDTQLQGSIGLGTAQLQYASDPSSLPWIPALPVQNEAIEASGITRIYFLEIVDRLAQFLDLKTGVLDTGFLIYGTDGNWVTNYVPSYTIELSVQYSE